MKKRIKSLDVLRGLTIALMILVNFQTGKVFPPLMHAEWFGLTLTDLVFPAFLTICGISLYLSLSKFDFKPCKESILKIIKRFILLLLVAYAIREVGYIIEGMCVGKSFAESALNFSKFRICGVLERTAFTCFIASLIIIFVKNKKAIIAIIVLLIVGYNLILVFGNGLTQGQDSILYKVDAAILGPDHLYAEMNAEGETIIFDPEGILSSIFCVSQLLVGFLVGEFLKKKNCLMIFVIGFSLMIVGYFYSFFIPFSKQIWTPSYMLMTAGITISMLALLFWIIDIKGYSKWGKFFEIYGLNGITTYALSEVIIIFLGNSGIAFSINEAITNIWHYEELVSLVLSFSLVFILWIFAFILYKAKIFIKL